MPIDFDRDGPWELPEGWVWVALRDLASPRGEKAPPDRTSTFAFVGMDDVPPNSLRIETMGEFRTMKSAGNKFYPNDLLYGRLRPYLNKVVVADFEGVASGEFIVMCALDGIEPRYLQLLMHGRRFVNVATADTSGDRPRIDFDKVADIEIPVAPNAEQRRIVARIDELFTEIADGEASLARARDDLDTWRRALLKAAVTGELTREWREIHQPSESGGELLERIRTQRVKLAGAKRSHSRRVSRQMADVDQSRFEIPDTWCWASWSDVGLSQNGRPFPSQHYSSNGIKLLRPGNLYADGKVRWNSDNTRYLPTHYSEENPDLLISGREIIINLTAQSLKDEFLGRTCMTDGDEQCLLNQRLARLTPIHVLPEFILIVFKSPLFRSFVRHLNSGSLIQHMFTSQIESFEFPLPPTAEQKAIVDRVGLSIEAIDELAGPALNNAESASELRQSILKSAFEGRLVEQDPRDEPAERLLARLSERAEAVARPRHRTRGRRIARAAE